MERSLAVLALALAAVQLGAQAAKLPVTVAWSAEAPSDALIVPIFADYNVASAAEGLVARVEAVRGAAGVTGWLFSAANRADDIYYGMGASCERGRARRAARTPTPR